ncbi:capsular biosynthesis protein [Photobacterium aquimaris]|uniref:Capsular biosynthesis protein n=1 Tax=Photobacterium aquimaris TaxID=512643 RepID=A0A2T3IPS6_9GAMM|nr:MULTISPECIES: capsular biosynthesis protein [Photobacterium]OBU17232.1 capsular biosynthesis protein [Photobacterium aquimaris]OBU17969.1 capsular biosynthesis protein [Photobacterium aquimaris]PSU30353.1 capsular biosynthesis protein [Photobacterium aquimaris]PSW00326.1 capsular biosynthesis protein [Photobacterium aquimaris]
MNTGAYFQVYVFVTLVFSGLAQYFTGVNAFLWLPFVMTIGMVALLPLQTRYNFRQLDRLEIMIIVLFVGLFVLALTSSLLQEGIKPTIAGIKNSLGIPLLLLCLILGFCRESQIYRITEKLYWVFYAQIPVIVYQILIVVPARVAAQGKMDSWDSVVGTFGGSMNSGGNGASMGLFAMLIMLMKLSEYKHGVATLKSLLFHLTIGFAIAIIAQVQFVVLFAPIFMMYVFILPSYVKEVKPVNMKTIILGIVIISLLVGAFITILAVTYANQYSAKLGIWDMFMDNVGYIFDTHAIIPGLNGRVDELGRLTSLFFWAKNSTLHGVVDQLFGYGLNSSNPGGNTPGYISMLFNLNVGSTALAIYLWEVGFVGTSFLVLICLLIIWNSKPKPMFSKDDLSIADIKLLSRQPAFIGFTVAGLVTLPYAPLLALIPVYQFQFYLCLGAMLIIRKVTINRTSKMNCIR